MLISEFIDRTGFRPTEDYYHTEIEPEYNRSNLDKDAWCKQWKKNGGIQNAYNAMCKAAASLECEVLTVKGELNTKKERCDYLSKELAKSKEQYAKYETLSETAMSDLNDHIENEKKMMETLIEISETYSAKELRDLIIEKIGFKAYITYKLQHDKCIWAVDRDTIIENLK